MLLPATIDGVTGNSTGSRHDSTLGLSWPRLAVHLRAVSASRGERIKQARQLRRLSQQELADATDVSVRTVRRIETGENESTRALTILETYLELAHSPGDPDTHTDPTERLDQDTLERALDQATFLDLLAALARKHSRVAKDTENPPDLPSGRYVMRTEDAPSARRAQDPSAHKDQPDEARGGHLL
jgi:transcriptional regulator with XRE-family HTH domain